MSRWWGDWILFRLRYSWRSGWKDLILRLSFLATVVGLILLPIFRGTDYVKNVISALFPSPTSEIGKGPLTPLKFVGWIFSLNGYWGCIALLVFLFVLAKKYLGNLIEVDLQRHVNSPKYEGSVSFVERFHDDFSKIVKAYAGKRRVYVFLDDLDRCEVPKAAELMQAINLMVASNPQLIFIIGMDWETVAAGIAVKNARLAPYLKPAAKGVDGAVELGREFVEKFIQLRFRLPRPGDEEIQHFLLTLSRPNARPRNPGLWYKLVHSSWLTYLRVRVWLFVATFRFPTLAPPKRNEEERTQAEVSTSELRELIQFGTEADSNTIQAVTRELAPAFENNPRRLKQFLGLYRLRIYIAKRTGLLAIPNGRPASEATTLEQLGKITAIELRWPLLLLEAANDHDVLGRLELEALGLTPLQSSDGRWISQRGIKDVFRAGFADSSSDGGETAGEGPWSLENLDVGRLLRVSPYVGAFDSRIAQTATTGVTASPTIEGGAAIITPPTSAPKTLEKILQVPRVFNSAQRADFFKVDNINLTGFNLSITVPPETYWRCGFVLAPEDYIREGRDDISITRYLLFHVFQGDPRAPKQPTGLGFQVYKQDGSSGPQPFSSESPVQVSVTLGADGHVAIHLGDVKYETSLHPRYLRYLYVLAWADQFGPFRVPIELTLFSESSEPNSGARILPPLLPPE